MTYGDIVGTENRDEIWTQQVQERNAANTLGGLHTMHKAEQAHPSAHSGAAMQSHGDRSAAPVKSDLTAANRFSMG